MGLKNNTIPTRFMILRDLAEALAIERANSDCPLSKDDFTRMMRQRNCIGMVVEIDDHITGYMLYEQHRTRIHILAMAVDPRLTRRGIGTALINKLKSKLIDGRREGITVVTRETNLAAALFFKSQGFKAMIAPSYFADEDGYSFAFYAERLGPKNFVHSSDTAVY